MAPILSSEVLWLLGVGVFAVGCITGVAGSGFAILGTMTLAVVIDPATAVAFMIVPVMAMDLALVRELPIAQLRSCGRRFSPLILTAVVGTFVGMAALDRLSESLIRVALGLLSLVFVAGIQEHASLPSISTGGRGCLVETPLAMAGVGSVSGMLFGGTNVGIQFLAYMRSCEFSHRTLISVVALVFLGLNTARFAVAGVLGLYPDSTIAAASVAAAVPAVAGVAAGKRVRRLLEAKHRRTVVLGLLTVIGVRLLVDGARVA